MSPQAAPPPKDVRSLHQSMTAFASILTNPFSQQEIEDDPIETPRRDEKSLVVEIDLDVYGP